VALVLNGERYHLTFSLLIPYLYSSLCMVANGICTASLFFFSHDLCIIPSLNEEYEVSHTQKLSFPVTNTMALPFEDANTIGSLWRGSPKLSRLISSTTMISNFCVHLQVPTWFNYLDL